MRWFWKRELTHEQEMLKIIQTHTETLEMHTEAIRYLSEFARHLAGLSPDPAANEIQPIKRETT